MLKSYQHRFRVLFELSDAFSVSLAWILAYWLRFYLPLLGVEKGLPPFERYLELTFFAAPLWWAVFSWRNLYSQGGSAPYELRSLLSLLKAHCVSLLCFVAMTYFITEYRYSRIVILYFGAIGFILMASFRWGMRQFFLTLKKGNWVCQRVVYVGEGRSLDALIQKVQNSPELGFTSLGFFSFQNQQSNFGLPYLGKPMEVCAYLHKHSVDQLIVSFSSGQASFEWQSFFHSVQDEMIDIHLVPDWYDYVTLGCTVDSLEGIPLVHLNDSPLHGWHVLGKRFMDVILATLGLFLFSPLFLVIAFLIKNLDRGPIFYRQERMGLDGQTFQMLKFRSMKMDAEKESGAVWAKPEDGRRTALGTFLRKTSLDELPQFWNVLKGEMSLVGPRPERPVFVKEFREKIPHYMLRHKVKAGITGWAQVQGWRGNTSLEKRIECDLYYIRNWSIGLDIWILWLTLWKGFVHKNAY